MLEPLKKLPPKEFVLDGEVVALDKQGRSSFQLLQSFQMAGVKKPPLFYYAFDLINLDGKDLSAVPLYQRKAIAETLLTDVSPAIRFSPRINADSTRLIREMKARGLEGLIAKRRQSKYEPGRRSGAWVKFKWTNEQEFVIGGYSEPKIKNFSLHYTTNSRTWSAAIVHLRTFPRNFPDVGGRASPLRKCAVAHGSNPNWFVRFASRSGLAIITSASPPSSAFVTTKKPKKLSARSRSDSMA